MMMVMLMLMVVMATAVLTFFVMMVVLMMMVMMCMLFLQLCQFGCQGSLAFHGVQQLLAGQFTPGGGNDGCLGIVFPQHFHGGIQLLLGNGVGTGEDDGGSSLHLIVVELTEVLHIDLYLTGIHNCHGIAQSHILIGNLIDSANNIGQLAHAGGLNEDPLRIILVDNLLQRLAEITHQRAADAAGVHFGDIDARILQETAVNANLTELVLDKHQPLACIGLLNHFLNEGGLACTQEATVNINLSHKNTPSVKIFYLVLYHLLSMGTRVNIQKTRSFPPGFPKFRFYRTNVMLRVVDQASPGFRIAAAGFSSHLVLPPSGLGRLCQGSMQTNLGIPGLLHSSV